MKKILPTALFVLAATIGSANAQVVVRIGPPPPRREVIIERPSPRHIWIAGYHRWDGREYAWVPGTWVIPPQPSYHRWVPGHWRHAPDGWLWVEGHWAR